ENSLLFNNIVNRLTKLQNINTMYAKKSWNETTTLFHHSVKVTVVIIMIVIILALLIGILIVQSITFPIQLLNTLLSNIANNDLTTYAPTDYGVEFGQ